MASATWEEITSAEGLHDWGMWAVPPNGWALLAVLYRAGSRRGVGFDGADWWSGRAGCYPIGDEHVTEEKKDYEN
jgi:hypothetical protein